MRAISWLLLLWCGHKSLLQATSLLPVPWLLVTWCVSSSATLATGQRLQMAGELGKHLAAAPVQVGGLWRSKRKANDLKWRPTGGRRAAPNEASSAAESEASSEATSIASNRTNLSQSQSLEGLNNSGPSASPRSAFKRRQRRHQEEPRPELDQQKRGASGDSNSDNKDTKISGNHSSNYKDNNNSNSSGSNNGLSREVKLETSCPAASEEAGSTPAVFGLRCDNGAEVVDGLLVIKANEPTELMLIGKNLDKNVSVALTSEQSGAQSDCTHADRVRSFQFKNLSSTIAQMIIDAPALNKKLSYGLCLRDSKGHWLHQGSDPWLRLYVKEDYLPLYMKIVVVACLLMLSGLFSGLNLGLMALDKNELQVIISCGTETEKRYARAIEPVRRRGNYLLCSILFSNVLVNSTIAVLLEELTSGIVAVMTSTIFIVMFGEILPQAFCSRHGLAVGAKTVSITYFCMIVTFPLSYPVSSCLDWALGEEIGHAYDRERLMEFIRVTRDYNNLETDEVNIISGALKLKRIPLSEVMTRIEDVYMLDMNAALDFDTIQAIIERGYSRIPVHEAGNKKNILALLFAKDLALLDPDDKTPVKTLISFYNHPIMYLFEDTTLDLALNEFKTGKSHMAIVRRVIDDGDRDPVYEITGIVTLEDVIEEIMQMEINDETDTLSDNRRKRRRKEAQVRHDFAQFTHFGNGESSENVVSPQLCLAAYQYLATTVEPFSSKYISDTILKRLLSQRIYFKLKVEDASADERHLYKAGEPADHFIMILEGRVHVVCGREKLVFEAGPFSFFGQAALWPAPSWSPGRASVVSQGAQLPQLPQLPVQQQAVDCTQSAGRQTLVPAAKPGTVSGVSAASGAASASGRKESGSIFQFQPGGLLGERRDHSATLSGPAQERRKLSNTGQVSLVARRLEQQLLLNADSQPEGATVTGEPQLVASEMQSQTSPLLAAPTRSPNSAQADSARPSLTTLDTASRSSQSQPFVPDYTVEVVSTTSYLKIARTEYLAALRATRVERGAQSGAALSSFWPADDTDTLGPSNSCSPTSQSKNSPSSGHSISTKPNSISVAAQPSQAEQMQPLLPKVELDGPRHERDG